MNMSEIDRYVRTYNATRPAGIYKLERYAGEVDGAGKPITTVKLVSPPTREAAQRAADSIFEQTGVRWDVVAG